MVWSFFGNSRIFFFQIGVHEALASQYTLDGSTYYGYDNNNLDTGEGVPPADWTNIGTIGDDCVPPNADSDELSTVSASAYASSITISDNTHYITSSFSTGSLTVDTANSGTTGSSSTGHTQGNPDPYLYLESSANSQDSCGDNTGVTQGSSQYVESNIIDVSSYDLYFEFDWNMNVNGNTDSSLHVDAYNGSSWDLDVSGGAINTSNNVDSWESHSPIDLTSHTNFEFKLRIRYVIGSAGSVYRKMLPWTTFIFKV